MLKKYPFAGSKPTLLQEKETEGLSYSKPGIFLTFSSYMFPHHFISLVHQSICIISICPRIVKIKFGSEMKQNGRQLNTFELS
jgi:hypothetical protein